MAQSALRDFNGYFYARFLSQVAKIFTQVVSKISESIEHRNKLTAKFNLLDNQISIAKLHMF